jgi:hypothetical protein
MVAKKRLDEKFIRNFLSFYFYDKQLPAYTEHKTQHE